MVGVVYADDERQDLAPVLGRSLYPVLHALFGIRVTRGPVCLHVER